MAVQITPFNSGSLRDIAIRDRQQANADRVYELNERRVSAAEAANKNAATQLTQEQKEKAMAAIPGAIEQAISIAQKAPEGRRVAAFNAVLMPYINRAESLGLPMGEAITALRSNVTEESFAIPENFGKAIQGVDAQGNPVFAQVGDRGTARVIDGLSPTPKAAPKPGNPFEGTDAQGNRVMFRDRGDGTIEKVEGVMPKVTPKQQQDAAEAENQAQKTAMFKSEVVDLAQSILKRKDAIDSAYGSVSGLLPSFSQETVDLEADVERLADLLTLDNMDLMTGVLSESDIKILARAGSKIGNFRIGEAAAKKELNRIIQQVAGIPEGMPVTEAIQSGKYTVTVE